VDKQIESGGKGMVSRALPGQILICLEIVWVFVFAGIMFWILSAEETVAGIEHLRSAILLAALHAGTPYAVLVVVEKTRDNQMLPYAPFFWVVMAFFTDVGSSLDAYQHSASADVAYLNGFKVVVTFSSVLSAASICWYAYLIVGSLLFAPPGTKHDSLLDLTDGKKAANKIRWPVNHSAAH
jgi:hypothetical protein